MKLGKRLQKIEQMVLTARQANAGYSHVWDCCCDHGLLGAALLTHKAADTVHFVDIVPELMAQIDEKLARFYADRQPHTWQTHCLDVAALPLSQYQGKHLVIIAGVGGDLMLRFIQEIHRAHPDLAIDFLLCPVHHQFALRQALIAQNFSLIDEVLVTENRRFYEVLQVSSNTDSSAPISPVGDKIWRSTSTEEAELAKSYLKKTLAHYRRIQLGRDDSVEHILKAYSHVESLLCSHGYSGNDPAARR
ncbi:tRNA (adenine(22)-N(1))-methyltransferase [Corallincola spongiicola]|uniref:SAM-dependent methyltransferase n=1 Tax=Corallincola spongiicola TaxID=2520508 RepID=A0ABY1WU52_9GAMM|nr:tRNA (adenine(22)-N(1))-methyltransferase TrmK [Corallincola spongiicola]TAA48281.1 SAM-dependent methyltransferase [Corallincola spongiicola]